jgi:ribA/ribD-fused uncharacterized protein
MEKRIYDPKEVISFRKTTEPFGGLSNMASGYSIFINNVIIPSSEHLYQAMRYPLFPEIQHEIISQDNAMKAKMVSNKYKEKYSRPDWEMIQFKVMRWVLEVKLAQNWEKFSQILLSTENKPIVEFTTEDKVWGACKVADKLEGVNALGRLLMELRQKYVLYNDRLYCVEPINVPAFLLYNHPIELICDTHILEDLFYQPEYEEVMA